MKTFNELLQKLQDKRAEIYYEKQKRNSLNKRSEIIRMSFQVDAIIQELELRFKKEYNEL
ncbi:MAG: hypothetical protein EBT39_04875 [Sphingobacteriia bacterium]|jgi:hypothetical protein|nr:hypothetical protein [Candidatus Fonsibacter lacus]